MTLKNDWFMNEELIQYANQIGLTVIKYPKILCNSKFKCPLCACYSLNPFENSIRFVFNQNYLLFIYVENRKYKIITKNVWNINLDISTESLDEVKAIVTDELRKIKTQKIKIKLKEIEEDFLPNEVPEFNPYITDIVK